MDWSIETMLSHYAENRDEYKGAVVPPVYQNSLFTFENWDAIDAAFDDRVNQNIYSRANNPTVTIAEQKLAKLAGGERAKLFASGMAAITAAILHCVDAGDHIIAVNNTYGPANTFMRRYLSKKMNVETTFVQGEQVSDFEEAIRPNTRLIYLESPSSAIFSLQDIEAVATLAKQHNIKTIIDNTWATSVFQKPLAMGIDFEVHSCSKYIGGHSDIVAGLVIGKREAMEALYVEEVELLGGKMAPFEGWLILRSLRTLLVRMKAHQENALKVATFLENHPKIAQVTYPGLASFAQYDLGQKQMTGYGGLMAFRLKTDDLPQIKTFFNSLKLFKIGVSWGGHESLIYAPAISYLKELSPEQFAGMGISLGDMRISVGLEHYQDLIDDLNNALTKVL